MSKLLKTAQNSRKEPEMSESSGPKEALTQGVAVFFCTFPSHSQHSCLSATFCTESPLPSWFLLGRENDQNCQNGEKRAETGHKNSGKDGRTGTTLRLIPPLNRENRDLSSPQCTRVVYMQGVASLCTRGCIYRVYTSLCTRVYHGGHSTPPTTPGYTMVGIVHPPYTTLGTPPGIHPSSRLQCRCISGMRCIWEEALGSNLGE